LAFHFSCGLAITGRIQKRPNRICSNYRWTDFGNHHLPIDQMIDGHPAAEPLSDLSVRTKQLLP